jgi:hypothetical protein
MLRGWAEVVGVLVAVAIILKRSPIGLVHEWTNKGQANPKMGMTTKQIVFLFPSSSGADSPQAGTLARRCSGTGLRFTARTACASPRLPYFRVVFRFSRLGYIPLIEDISSFRGLRMDYKWALLNVKL